MTKSIIVYGLISLFNPFTMFCTSYDLSIFNWGEYISRDVLAGFEKEYNVKVRYRTFDSNELMLTKLESQKYDVIFPSDYAVEELAAKDLIQPIDWAQITSFNPETDMVPSLYGAVKNLKEDKLGVQGFDMLKYAVPYTWGEIGLLYNTKKISPEEIKRDGWEALRNPTNADGTPRRVVMYNAARDIYSMALIALGLPIVNIGKTEVDQASKWLIEQKKALGSNIAYKTEEILDDMPNLAYDLCFTYVGDAIYAKSEVKNDKGEHDSSILGFYIPEAKENASTRTNIYCDAMVIHKDTRHLDLAHKFINYMLKYESVYENTLEIGYTIPRLDVYDDITSEKSEYEDNQEGSYYAVRDAYRVDAHSKDVFYRYDEQLKSMMENEWIKVSNTR